MNYVLHLVGWAIIQSSWQITIVALLLVSSLRLMREVSASQRYICAVLHLATAIGVALVTVLASHASITLAPFHASMKGLPSNWMPQLEIQTSALIPAFAWIWLVGLAVALLLLALRLLRLNRFLDSTSPAPQHVTQSVHRMCHAANLTRLPPVVCADVESPMVAGVWPPRFVVPRAFGDRYSDSEIHALLAHELGHIVRRDYLANLLQLVALALAWWHPGAWLIYGRIRHERECACDEQALTYGCSRSSLARALLRLAETRTATQQLAMRVGSSGLADRISRIVDPGNGKGGRRTPLFLAAGLSLLIFLSLGASSTVSKWDSITRAYASSTAGPNTVFTIRANDPAGNFLVKMIRGRVVAIEIERQPVPSNRVMQHGDVVKVMGLAGQEVLRMEVDPRGGLRWTPRRPL